jgi:NitT/TauT family transport system substrate-binding protein
MLRKIAIGLLLIWPGMAALAADKVSVGTVGNSSDAAFFIAADKGYFAAEQLDVTFIPFDNAGRMMAPLGVGDLDIGAGTAIAGLYNAGARGIGIKVVADRSRMRQGYLFQSFVVRKAVIDSGRFKSWSDLKGLKVALLSNAGSPASALNEAAKLGKVKLADIDLTILQFPQQVPAFANGAIDASIMVEPFTSLVLSQGTAVRFSSSEDFVPSDQIGMVFYAEKFARERRDIGLRFMKAYIRALRTYNDAIKDGRFSTGAKGNEIVAMLARNLKVSEAQIRATWPQAIDPDGRVNRDSLQRVLDFFKEYDQVSDKSVTVDSVLDMSFVEQALKDLGPYRPQPD